MTRYLLIAAILFLFSPGICSASEEYYFEILKENGIEPTTESLAEYFKSLQPEGEPRRQIERLVLQLGADDFDAREDATRALMRSSIPLHTLLVDATRNSDPEIRWRASSVLEHADRHGHEVFFAVMTTIEKRRITGLVGPILTAFPYYNRSHLHAAMHRALRATVRVDDLPTLGAELSNQSPEIRVAAILALEAAAPAKLPDLLKSLLVDENERVRLAVARVYANLGDRACLPVLLALLQSDEVAVRSQSISILRSLSGQRFGFVAYDDDLNKRQLAVKSWSKWIDGDGQTVELHFPLEEKRQHLGRILVCNFSENFVTEFDETGKEIWKKEDLNHPWGVQVLMNDHRLVASCQGKYVVEFDPAGKEVWRKDGLPGNPLSVERLENGNTLVATGGEGKVVEIAPDGKIAWEIKLVGFMADARRLPDGLTLIANYQTGEVVEVDREGNIVWKIGGFKNTRGAQRLENGNTLVCDNGQHRIVECDRAGKIVWKFEDAGSTFYDCQRLPDGNTLIGDTTGLRLVDPAGESLWHRKMPSTGRIFAY